MLVSILRVHLGYQEDPIPILQLGYEIVHILIHSEVLVEEELVRADRYSTQLAIIDELLVLSLKQLDFIA